MLFRRISVRFASFSVLLICAGNAEAMSDLCRAYKDTSPSLYKLICTNGSGSTKPAGANSSFSDSFNLNSASLPTEPSSYGLETIGSYLRNDTQIWSPTFGLVKGFHKFGTGISTSGANTFYSDDVIQRLGGTPEVDSFKPHETATGKYTNLNIGTSIALHESSNGGAAVRLGISARYNKTTASWGGGPALLISWPHVTVGGGFTKEKISNFLPPMQFTSLLLSARFWVFELEYNNLSDNSPIPLSPVQIFTLTTNVWKFTLTAAHRTLDYVGYGSVSQNHFGVQYLFSLRFSAGVLYNYIPGATSFGIQYYL